MARLVGKLLVQTGSGTAVAEEGPGIFWRGFWTLHESPSGSGRDWQIVARGATDQGFATAGIASNAAAEQGLMHARELQGDHSLEAIDWTVPFPEVPQDIRQYVHRDRYMGENYTLIAWHAEDGFRLDCIWVGASDVITDADRSPLPTLDMAWSRGERIAQRAIEGDD